MDIIFKPFRDLFTNNVLLKIIFNQLPNGVSLPKFSSLLAPYVPFSVALISICVLLLLITGIIVLSVKLLSLKIQLGQKFTFLEVKPPSETLQSSYTTQQLFALIHELARQQSWFQILIGYQKLYSFEIVSSKNEGIRYLLRVNEGDADLIKKGLLAYLPGIKVIETSDYLTDTHKENTVAEFVLSSHFAFPLKRQDELKEHDPIAYITGNMTKLAPDEIVAFQLVSSTVNKARIKDINRISHMIYKNEDLVQGLKQNNGNGIVFTFGKFFLLLTIHLLTLPIGILVFAVSEGKEGPFLHLPFEQNKEKTLNPYQQELEILVKGKLDQPLFSTSVRLLVISNKDESQNRIRGFHSSISSFTNAYQSLRISNTSKLNLLQQLNLFAFRHRLLSFFGNSLLSISELTDLFHFPYSGTTDTENLVKVMSRELPAPLSLKSQKNLDVIFGKNTYGNTVTDIGLMDIDRTRHVYSLGQTGSGKSTIIYHMITHDIAKGRGVGILDPHGDLSLDILNSVPLERMNDLIYFNPFDIKYPVGINLLELAPCNDDDELELEKELVCESVISVFRRIFSKDEATDAHRIEYILRNTIYTAFTVKDATIFTVYDLLNNPEYLKTVLSTLEDENLQNFWKNEFGKAGNYQVVKMVSGVTARIGRFLFSPTAKRILNQPRSTINFNDILDSGKILICNLNEGTLGEDTSVLFGTTILAKIQQAAMRRSRMSIEDRKPFYLFVDEFQNFASSYFTKMLSGGRKFGLRIYIAEQSTAQQSDRSIVNVILANTGTVIGFHMASPVDQELLSAQFSPYVEKRELANLPAYHFYMKMAAIAPEEPFSGTTLPMTVKHDQEKINTLIEASRKNFATVYQKPVKLKIVEETKPPGKQAKKTKTKPDEINTLV